MMKVTIVNCNEENRWYKNLIGSTFSVKENDGLDSFIVIGMRSKHDSVFRIEKCDCEILESTQMDEFMPTAEFLQLMENFPDLQDGRVSAEQLREAADDWYWDEAHPMILKYRER